MSQTTRELMEFMEQLPEAMQKRIYRLVQAEAKKLMHETNGKQTASFLDVAERLGVVGIVQDGPADLSTNPQHMKGFGT